MPADLQHEIRTSNPRASELTLSSLKPYVTYQIKVFAVNSIGLSEASETIAATTYESSKADRSRIPTLTSTFLQLHRPAR